MDKVDFYETHVFKYSRREGTKAAVMPDQVPEPVKAERSAILLELSKKKQKAYEEAAPWHHAGGADRRRD